MKEDETEQFLKKVEQYVEKKEDGYIVDLSSGDDIINWLINDLDKWKKAGKTNKESKRK